MLSGDSQFKASSCLLPAMMPGDTSPHPPWFNVCNPHTVRSRLRSASGWYCPGDVIGWRSWVADVCQAHKHSQSETPQPRRSGVQCLLGCLSKWMYCFLFGVRFLSLADRPSRFAELCFAFCLLLSLLLLAVAACCCCCCFWEA